MFGGRTHNERSVRLALVLLILVYFAQHVRLPGYQFRILHRWWLRGRYTSPNAMFSPEILREIYALHDLLRGKDWQPRTPFECPNMYY